jgi:hypothetical protein
MNQHGASYGWRQVTAEEAQIRANEGRPAVVLWRNPTGIGHVQVVRPGTYDAARGATIAQAGALNTNNARVRDVLPSGSGETYWTHD